MNEICCRAGSSIDLAGREAAASLDLGRVPAIPLTTMRSYTAVVERCPETQLYVGYVPGFPGAHSQGGTLEELNENLKEVIAMLLDDGWR